MVPDSRKKYIYINTYTVSNSINCEAISAKYIVQKSYTLRSMEQSLGTLCIISIGISSPTPQPTDHSTHNNERHIKGS